MSITKFNKSGVTFDGVNLKEIKTWVKASECDSKKVYAIKAIGAHKAKFGDSVFAVTAGGEGINLPTWLTDTVKEVLADEESVEEIKAGKVGLKFSPYETKSGQKTTNVEFVEINPLQTDDLPY